MIGSTFCRVFYLNADPREAHKTYSCPDVLKELVRGGKSLACVSRTVLALLVAVVILSASTATLGVLLLIIRQPTSQSTPARMLAVQVSGVVDRSNITDSFWFQFSIGRFGNVSHPGSGGEVLRVVNMNVTNGSSPWPFVEATDLEAGKDYAFWIFVGSQTPGGPLGTFPTAFLDLQSPVSFSFRVWLAGSDWAISVTRSPST